MPKRTSSNRRIESSRANGAKSHGPITPEGKKISSQNAFKHGLCADLLVIEGEFREDFTESLDQFFQRFLPADDVERNLVEEMVAAYWRQRRTWAIETGLFNREIALNPQAGMVGALEVLAAKPALALMHRYEARHSLAYQRAVRTLLLLREKVPLPNEPSPIPECPPPEPPQLNDVEAFVGQPILAATGFQPVSEKPSYAHPISSPNAQDQRGAL